MLIEIISTSKKDIDKLSPSSLSFVNKITLNSNIEDIDKLFKKIKDHFRSHSLEFTGGRFLGNNLLLNDIMYRLEFNIINYEILKNFLDNSKYRYASPRNADDSWLYDYDNYHRIVIDHSKATISYKYNHFLDIVQYIKSFNVPLRSIFFDLGKDPYSGDLELLMEINSEDIDCTIRMSKCYRTEVVVYSNEYRLIQPKTASIKEAIDVAYKYFMK